MSEGIVIALVTAVGTVLGGIISQLIAASATIKAAEIKEKVIPTPSNEDKKSRSWNTVIGGALIGALVTLVLLSLLGMFPPRTETSPTPTSTATNTFVPTGTPGPLLESIAGIWTGIDEGTVGGNPAPGREIEITVLADCSIGKICGTSSTLIESEFCVKNLVLSEIKNETFMFEGIMKAGSASFCGEGGSITLTLIPDGTLSYMFEAYNASGLQVKKTATMNLR